MKITRRQLRRIIKERALNEIEAPDGTTPKDIAKDLLVAGEEVTDEIIDRVVAAAGVSDDDIPDFADAVSVELDALKESKRNTTKVKISKRQLRRIIKEERSKLLSEQDHQMYEEDDELRGLGDFIGDMLHYSMEVDATMKDMGMRYGELAALGTNARMIKNSIQELADKFDTALDDIVRYR